MHVPRCAGKAHPATTFTLTSGRLLTSPRLLISLLSLHTLPVAHHPPDTTP